MRIVWDEPKRLANLGRHQLDFRDLTVEFFLGALVRPAKHGRFQATSAWTGSSPWFLPGSEARAFR
jgi:uncharacterized DUF497 family protein